MQIKYPGDPHLREGVTPSPTLPLSALRASVKPSASLVTCAPPPEVEVLDPPLNIIDKQKGPLGYFFLSKSLLLFFC